MIGSRILDLVRRGARAVLNYVRTQRREAALGLGLALIAAVGLVALANAVNPLVSGALVVVICLTALRDEWKVRVLEFIVSVVVGVVTLLGFNVLTDVVINALDLYHEDSSPAWIVVGLAVGFTVFWVSAWAYLYWRGHWTRRSSLVAALAAGLFLIFAVPFIYDGASHDETERVPRQTALASQIDVFVIAEPRDRAEPPPAIPELPARSGFDVRYTVGFADGDRVRWSLAGATEQQAITALADPDAAGEGTPAPRADADRILLLVVDGTAAVTENPATLPDVPARRGEVRRWRRIARSAGLDETPAYALLQTTQARRLASWRRSARPAITEVSAQGFGSGLVTDAAFRLAVAAPTANEDFLLAEQHRPILLFDEDEQVPRPLSIEALFREGKIRECPLRGRCKEPAATPAELENGNTRLELDRPSRSDLRRVARKELGVLQRAAAQVPADAPEGVDAGAAPAGAPPAAAQPDAPAVPGPPHLSTIYVRPVPREVDHRSFLYLDYWWFLPDNPARAGGGAFCGAALVIPGVSCFDHESDWEGVTVVIDRTPHRDGSVTPTPVAVHYAEHSSVVRYDWNELRRRWDETVNRDGRYARFVDDASQRPLAFIARGTHAAYPLPCRGGCRQTTGDLEERPHDGDLPWAGNGAITCGDGVACLTPLPTSAGGNRPALWNAFTGPWGKSRCVAKYCNSTSPPSAPGTQGRYKRPWSCSGTAEPRARGFRYRRGGCESG